MAALETIILNDTIWGAEATKINSNFSLLNAAIESIRPVTSVVKSVNSIGPDSAGNIKITITSLGGLSRAELGAKNGVAKLDQNGKIANSLLYSTQGNKFIGIAAVSTIPEEGFYYTTSVGTFNGFTQQSGAPIVVSQEDVQRNLVIFNFVVSYWQKILIPFPKTTQASVEWKDIIGAPVLALVATTGSYNDLSDKPTYHKVATTGSYNDLSDKPTYHKVATTGSYNDLSDKPKIITIDDFDVAGGIPTLDENTLIKQSQIPAVYQQQGLAGFIGTIAPSTNPKSYIDNSFMLVWGICATSGTYSNFNSIEVTQAELATGIVILIGRTTFQKISIPFPTQEVSVLSVNGMVGNVRLTAADLDAALASSVGQPGGICELDSDGKVPTSRIVIPSASSYGLVGLLTDYYDTYDPTHPSYKLYKPGFVPVNESFEESEFTQLGAGISYVDLIKNQIFLRYYTKNESDVLDTFRVPNYAFALQAMASESHVKPSTQDPTWDYSKIHAARISDLSEADAISLLKGIKPSVITIDSYVTSKPGLLLEDVPETLREEGPINLGAIRSLLISSTQALINRLENPWISIKSL